MEYRLVFKNALCECLPKLHCEGGHFCEWDPRECEVGLLYSSKMTTEQCDKLSYAEEGAGFVDCFADCNFGLYRWRALRTARRVNK
jgi:hypothetical protein